MPEVNLKWNQNGKFKLLGISFDLFANDKTLANFKNNIDKIKYLLNSWIYRDLTYVGKITVIKSLALPILIQSLTVLPNPPDNVFKEIENTFFSFLWNKKPDKIKRKTIIGNYEEGGLKMPHIESFCMSLKMMWIHRLIDPLNISPWKTLIMDHFNRFGGDKIWMMSPNSLSYILPHFNRFWQDIFKNWGKLEKDSLDNASEILSKSIWFNEKLKIDNRIVFHEKWCEMGVFFVNDLLDENGEFMNFQKFKDTFNIRTNFLQFWGIIQMIPKSWRNEIKNKGKLPNITNVLYEYIKK